MLPLRLMAAFVGVALGQSAVAADWWFLSQGTDGVALLADHENIVEERDERTMWIAFIQPQVSSDGTAFLLGRWTFDCRRRDARYRQGQARDENYNILDLRDRPQEMRGVEPGTLLENSMEFVCSEPSERFASTHWWDALDNLRASGNRYRQTYSSANLDRIMARMELIDGHGPSYRQKMTALMQSLANAPRD